ncbi:MAG TPA: plastocyanin/azurin family copper-binding protein [Nitrososphaera sp.]|nr:plastocyanin/azurin family copper-binding protein [Nitrososphaera sp.]
MDSKIAVAVGLAAVLAAMLAPISTLTPAFAADVAADVTTGSSSKTNDAYAPNPININVGDTVTWTNKDSTAHTVTSGTGNADPNKGQEFDSSPNFSPLMVPQGTFSHKFDAEGSFPYFCALHENMKGTVIVASGGEPEPEPEPEPTPQEFSVTATINGEEHPTPITGTGEATATSATINPNEKSIVIEFDGAGAVQLTLPKDMIRDITMVNGEQATIVSQNDTSTTISFEVPEGETAATIQAGFVVPEFPVIAAILAATIAGIIGYTRFARNGTGFFGRA